MLGVVVFFVEVDYEVYLCFVFGELVGVVFVFVLCVDY